MSSTPLNVLLVEDEASEARAVARRLETRWATSVVIASNGGAAMSELDSRRYDLVIADVGLPDVSGVDVLRATREKQPHAYCAALTGSFERDLVHSVALLGAFFVNKPAPTNVLEEVVVRAERRRTAHGATAAHVERKADAWRLSSREREILKWLVDLKTRAQWCEAFMVEPCTFDTQVKNIRAKMPGRPPVERIVQALLLDIIEARGAADSES